MKTYSSAKIFILKNLDILNFSKNNLVLGGDAWL
jgi:hypothetical protein